MFCHFGLFFALFVREIWCMTDVIVISHFGLLFPLLYSPKSPKNQNFEKMKKNPGNIIILHKCTINENHMMYVSWDIMHDRQNFLSFWTVFCPFTPLTTQKIKIFKEWKCTWRYHHFTQVQQKSWSYAILFLRYGVWWMQLLFFILGYFLPFSLPNNLKNQNLKKSEKKNHLQILSFYTSAAKIMIICYSVP